jgi:histidyl-tRNA synthetase
MGIDRIMLMAKEPELDAPLDAFVVIATPERRDAALELVSELRRRGLRTDVDLAERSVSAQFKAADRRGARTALVVGDEWSEGSVTARDLASGAQEAVAIEEIEQWLQH